VPCGDASEELPPRFFQSLEARAETSMYDMIPEDFIATCAWAFRRGDEKTTSGEAIADLIFQRFQWVICPSG